MRSAVSCSSRDEVSAAAGFPLRLVRASASTSTPHPRAARVVGEESLDSDPNTVLEVLVLGIHVDADVAWPLSPVDADVALVSLGPVDSDVACHFAGTHS